eukprot:gene16920-17107_t
MHGALPRKAACAGSPRCIALPRPGLRCGRLCMAAAGVVSIKQRFSLSLAVLICVAVVQTSAFAYVQYLANALQQQQQLMTSVTEHQMFGDMKHDGVQGDVFRLIDAQQRGDSAKLHEAATATDQDIDALIKTYDFVFAQTYPEPLQTVSQKTVGDRDAYVASARTASDRIQHFPQDYRVALDAFTAAFDQFEHSQETLTAAIKAERDREAARGDLLFKVSMTLTLVSALAMAAAMGWASQFMLRRVVRPIEQLAATLRRMAGGDYAQDIYGNEAGDEMEQMAAAAGIFRQTALAMQQSELDQQAVVRELACGLEQLAERDLEYRIETALPAQYEGLRENFNRAARSLAQALGAVRVGAASLTRSIADIRGSADDLSQRNLRQAASLEETSAAMNQVNASVQQTASGAAAVRDTIARAQHEASEGGAVASQLGTLVSQFRTRDQETRSERPQADLHQRRTSLIAESHAPALPNSALPNSALPVSAGANSPVRFPGPPARAAAGARSARR